MTPEAQQQAIGEACGITNIRYVTGRGLVYVIKVDGVMEERRVPNYPYDLNAMREAFSVFNDLAPLTRHQWWQRYFGKLSIVLDVPFDFMPQFSTEHQIKFYEATAAQKAEAFLRTIGKLTP